MKALRVKREDRWRTPRLRAAKRAQDTTIDITVPPPPELLLTPGEGSPIGKLAAAQRAQAAKFDWLEKDEYPRGLVAPTSTPTQSTGGLEAAIAGNQWQIPALTEKALKDFMDEAMKWSAGIKGRVVYVSGDGQHYSKIEPAPSPPDDPLEFWADGTFLRWSRPAAVGEQDIHDRILFPWPVEILEGEVGRLCLRTGVDVVEMTWQPGAFMTTVKVALGHWRFP